MLKKCLFFLLLSSTIRSGAQYAVTFRINNLPPYHNAGDTVYITGDFNNWNPGQKGYVLKRNTDNSYSITLLLKGKHEYKMTRGNWAKGESGNEGTPTQNRVAEIISDTTLPINIEQWADHFSKGHRRSTASRNVQVLDTAFYMPQLKRHRRIWIYLPEGYAASAERYPVLYMHDGQNVFDEATSFAGEWGVDEAMDSLGKQHGKCIVVAIDNGGEKRMNEYSPFDMTRYGKGEGSLYVDFLVKTLKPYIDKRYRTGRGAEHCYTAGSSMGGLISFYAMLKYPDVFGGAGVFSPAFWIVPQLKGILAQKAKKVTGKIYFYAGGQEGETMVPDMLAVFEQMNKSSTAKMTTVIRSEGRHTEGDWQREFPLFYKWLRQDEN